ncbi:hypothetical protein [Mumia sp. Pv 4-285]|uniref:hypothetical protein n=1 Tax=Mumia qirimensis TaxID=3234852 RepID=UPI00351D91C4
MLRSKVIGAFVALVAGLGLVAAGTAPAEAHARHKTGYTQVVVAPDVYALVAGAGITPAPIEGAKAAPYKDTLAAKFPITGYSLGKLRIKHSGGISLTAGAATISLKNFFIDLGRLRVSGEVSGSIGDVGRADLFKIGLSDRRDLGVVRLRLTDTAAGALNATFGVEAFSAGDTFGYATPKPFSRF